MPSSSSNGNTESTRIITGNHYHNGGTSSRSNSFGGGGDGSVSRDRERGSSATEGWFSAIANRILFHRAYAVFYAIVVIFQLALFIYGVSNYVIFRDLEKHDKWYIICDIIVTILLALEVIIRTIATWKTYWLSCANMLDFVIMILCICTLFFYMVDPQAAIYGSLILSIRYAGQLFRLILVLKSARDRRRMIGASESDVIFTDLDTSNESYGDIPRTPRSNKQGQSQPTQILVF